MTDVSEDFVRSNIAAFEKKYLHQLQHWSGYVAPDDLDGLLALVKQVQTDSESITALMKTHHPHLFDEIWAPVLEQVAFPIPKIIVQMELLKKNTKLELRELGKGEAGLRGYRNVLPGNPASFESEG